MKAPITDNIVVIDVDEFGKELVKVPEFIELCGNESVELSIIELAKVVLNSFAIINVANKQLRDNQTALHTRLSELIEDQKDNVKDTTIIVSNKIGYALIALMSALLLTQIL
jgi:L-cystine uptake protein TcyP (sodium:dicarboxylate symporter family)